MSSTIALARWSDSDIDYLKKMATEKISADEMARRLGRSTSSIQQKLFRLRILIARPKKTVELMCQQCGIVFAPSPYRYRKFCSGKCFHNSEIRVHDKSCVQCGTIFRPDRLSSKRHNKVGRYCSNDCKKSFRSKHLNGVSSAVLDAELVANALLDETISVPLRLQARVESIRRAASHKPTTSESNLMSLFFRT